MLCWTLGCSILLEEVSWTDTSLTIAKFKSLCFLVNNTYLMVCQLYKVGVVGKIHANFLFESWCVYPSVDEFSNSVILG